LYILILTLSDEILEILKAIVKMDFITKRLLVYFINLVCKNMIMQRILFSSFLLALSYLAVPITGYTQAPANSTASPGKGLFETDKVLEITLSGNTKDLLNDRGDNPKYHPLTVVYKGDDNNEISLRAEGKTRGHFRKLRSNCIYPPILVHFINNDTLKASMFDGQDKLKLVVPCRGDEFVVYEWLVYKVYNLVTPMSFRARLVKVKLNNSKNNKSESPFYGILLEEEKQMAKRNGLVSITKKLNPEQTEPGAFINLAVFEYLIGNTDWSVQYLQNIKLLAVDSNAVPTTVAYDFDHSGMVDAPYALPAEQLNMTSVRQRRYRGYCISDMKVFDDAIALFNRIKKDIYALYTDCTLIDEKYKKNTLKYLDDFYATINNPDKVKKEFGYPCDKRGTGNVIIGGLKVQKEDEE
jgi:hypothetical protein